MARKRAGAGDEPGPAFEGGRQALSSRHERTRAAIFVQPTRANLVWGDVKTLLEALGAEVRTGGGSMYAFRLNGRRIVLHRPHPGNELAKGAVEAVRDFLSVVGEGLENEP
ncbi:MAG: type II toxin-antitoxin system HicA family toxin [Isosphaeraceae bacterium]